jgi:hypothetical protein
LLDQIVIELSAALIGGKHFVALYRRPQTIPADDDRAGPLVRVVAQQEIGEAKDGACALAIAATNGFRQGMVRAMGKGVAVNHQQGSTRERALTNPRGTPSPSRPLADPMGRSLRFGEAVAGAIVLWPLARRREATRRSGSSLSFTHTAA